MTGNTSSSPSRKHEDLARLQSLSHMLSRIASEIEDVQSAIMRHRERKHQLDRMISQKQERARILFGEMDTIKKQIRELL